MLIVFLECNVIQRKGKKVRKEEEREEGKVQVVMRRGTKRRRRRRKMCEWEKWREKTEAESLQFDNYFKTRILFNVCHPPSPALHLRAILEYFL
jgi:hypothetical protein